MSIDEYHRLGESGIIGERTELIRGVVVDKMSQSPLHCYIVQVLLQWLASGVGDHWTVRPGLPVTTADSEPKPDVCVVAGGAHDYVAGHPTTAALAIEVSISSERLDREKAAIYAEAGIDEYWIVFGERQNVEVHRAPVAGRYTEIITVRLGESIAPMAFPQLSIPVASLFPPAA